MTTSATLAENSATLAAEIAGQRLILSLSVVALEGEPISVRIAISNSVPRAEETTLANKVAELVESYLSSHPNLVKVVGSTS